VNSVSRTAVVCVLAIALALASATAPAATFHVAPDGSDSASGQLGAPLRTIGRATSLARTGDIIEVAAGRYPEQVTLGTRQAGVQLRGVSDASGGRAVIAGDGTRQYGFYVGGATNASIEGFEITGQTESGVYARGSGIVVAGNVIHHIGAVGTADSEGIRVVRGEHDVVLRNTIHHIGPGGEAAGVRLVQAREAQVDANTVYLVRKSGIRDWQGIDNAITSNRVFLGWVGISFNTSTGSLAANNYVYDNVEGFDAKHTSYSLVLDYWKLATPHWSRFIHNTVYRSTDASVWIAQSGEPMDYLQVADNIFQDAGTAYVRDAPALRGLHLVVDGNAYVRARPTTPFYKDGWSTPGLTDWSAYVARLGWERNGLRLDPQLNSPALGDLDYPQTSPVTGSLPLDSAWGRQLGARGLPAADVVWTPYPMSAIDASSQGTYATRHNLPRTADDIQSTYWITATDHDEYVTYDFGQRRTFDHLVLTLFSHGDMRNPHGYRFEVSDDARDWRTILQGDNPDAWGSSYKYELPRRESGRYLRYTMVDTSCRSYTPRAGCGAYFVFSDLKAGLISPAAAPPASETAPAAAEMAGSAPDADGALMTESARRASAAPARTRQPIRLPTVDAHSGRILRHHRIGFVMRCSQHAGNGCRARVGLRVTAGRTSLGGHSRRDIRVSLPAGATRMFVLQLGPGARSVAEKPGVWLTLTFRSKPPRSQSLLLRHPAEHPRR
jgi:hypothetical protein